VQGKTGGIKVYELGFKLFLFSLILFATGAILAIVSIAFFGGMYLDRLPIIASAALVSLAASITLEELSK